MRHALPSQRALLAHPSLEDRFWQNYAEGRLLTYDISGGVVAEDGEETAELAQFKDHFQFIVDQQGPIIVTLNLSSDASDEALLQGLRLFFSSSQFGWRVLLLTLEFSSIDCVCGGTRSV